ncbi:MAG: DUF1131 family protein [Rhodobacteraceae bacterium]|nr:DUF1131 family protein [Paracoccaceae bacterium]
MRFTASGLVCLFGLLLASCSPSVDYSGDLGSSSASGPKRDTSLLQITDSGVGGITVDTTYGPKSIAAVMPGYTTDGIQSAVETTTEWATVVFNADGFQVLQAFKAKNGKVREVHGVSPFLQGPNGERIDMSFDQIGLSRRNCRVGKALWRGMAICQAKNTSNVELVFAIPQYQGPFDRLPPDDELRQATLQRILWTPNA